MVSIIIPTYGNPPSLKTCLESVRAYTDVPYELLIIDNGSSPNGYVRTANQGLRAARGDVLILLNDDTTVTENWIKPLLNALTGDVWAVSPSHRDHAENWVNDQWELNGYCTVMTRECYETLGPLDEKYIHWLTDCTLPQSIVDYGKKTKIVLESIVDHNRRTVEDRPGLTEDLYNSWKENDYKDVH